MSGLDPRSPLVLDTRELGRRPGVMQRVRRSVPAPDDLGVGGVVGVPPGTDVELDLRLEAVVEGVLVSGTARAAVAGECVRCLDPVRGEVVVDLQELYGYPDRAPEDHDGSEADDVDLRVEDERIDLEPALRDAVVLALPLAPVCRDDCPGLCPECGTRLADDAAHSHDTTDPRWAALGGLLGAGTPTRTSARDGVRGDRPGPNDQQPATGLRAGPTEET
ncbi:MAG TPA: DUF177 domain-containing protein [Jiangellales bacterium]|nr:DUF177 domain-containing protein [Jiangellales bacterium]